MKFEESFLDELFSIIIHKQNYIRIVKQLKFSFLISENQKKLLKFINKQILVYDRIPNLSICKQNFIKDDDVLEYLVDLVDLKTDESTEKQIIDSFEDFIQRNIFVENLTKIINLFNSDKSEEAFDLYKKSQKNLSRGEGSEGSDYEKIFGDFNKNYANKSVNKRSKVKFKFLIDGLDLATNGGAEEGEIVLFLAPSGAGKTHALIHCSIAAARQGLNVAHFSLEGTKGQIRDRFDAAWSGTRYYDVKNHDISDEKFNEIQIFLNNSMPRGEVFLQCHQQFNSLDLMTLRNKVIDLINQRDIKVLVIDYFELLEIGDGVVYNPSQERNKHQKISRLLKNLAVELNIIIITATQASDINSEFLNDPDFIITRNHLSEDKGKIRAFDLFFTFNQTKEEKKKGILRIANDKAREHKGGQIVHICQNLAHSRFYDRKRTLNEFIEDEDEYDLEDEISKLQDDDEDEF